jgi:hypothetical protein
MLRLKDQSGPKAVLEGRLMAMALLHDIGKLVYFKFFPAHIRELN